ncbi:MAG: hypothetical protein KAH03_05020 [Cocleimonas sp.]|nr:hypothetical protein [Cocleimonas sp.]
MFKVFKKGVIYAFLLLNTTTAIAGDPFKPSYPSVPSDYQELQVQRLIADAAVNFPAYYIDQTNGYKVIAPNGTEFVVDNVVEPKCAFYGTYIAPNKDGFLSVSSAPQITSNVYIGEVNFDKCQ